MTDDADCSLPLLSRSLSQLEVVTDELSNLLDDMAGLGEHWARNRAKGITPGGIRDAMLRTAMEIAFRIETGTGITRRPVG